MSADSIVPDPTNPQQYNRYTYSLNNPLRYIDPTGHCIENYYSGSETDNYELYSECLDAWTTLYDHYYSITGDNPDQFPLQYLTHQLQYATIESLISQLEGFGITYSYSRPPGESTGADFSGSNYDNYQWTHAGNLTCQYWQDCYKSEPVSDFVSVSASAGPWIGPTGTLSRDKYGNIYLTGGVQLGTPGFAGSITTGTFVDPYMTKLYLSSEEEVEQAMVGHSQSGGGGAGAGIVTTMTPGSDIGTLQVGVFTPQVSGTIWSYTFLIYDAQAE